MASPTDRLRMAREIFKSEVRRDKGGHISVYVLPPDDGGGQYEVAGLNEKYNKEVVDHLVNLIRVGEYDEAETLATEAIAQDTDNAAKLTDIPSVEFYLRDCWFNRGERGAKRIFQRALGVTDDGVIGVQTLDAKRQAEKDPEDLLVALRVSRQEYEMGVVGYRSNFWRGLVNRWDHSLEVARTFSSLPVTPAEPPASSWVSVFLGALMALFRRSPSVSPPVPVPSTLADRLVATMKKRGFRLDTGDAQANIVYVEGMSPEGVKNDNAPNQFNDARFVIIFGQDGRPTLAGAWQATTEPSRFWTENPMNALGAARIKFGQYTAWNVGQHHGHEALVQSGGEVTVCRDLNKDYKREGDKEDTGFFGINNHWGYDLPRDDLGRSSAGCLVGRMKKGHEEFMALVKSDPRYIADHKFTFTAAVIPASEV